MECEAALKHRWEAGLVILGLYRGEGGILSLLECFLVPVFSLSGLFFFFLITGTDDARKLIK